MRIGKIIVWGEGRACNDKERERVGKYLQRVHDMALIVDSMHRARRANQCRSVFEHRR